VHFVDHVTPTVDHGRHGGRVHGGYLTLNIPIFANLYISQAEGIEALIQMRCTNEVTKGSVTSSLMSTIISLVFRHCIDSEKPTLRETYEQTIKQACSGLPICMLESTSRRHALRAKRYQKDPKVF
jgi:hypothetical protein